MPETSAAPAGPVVAGATFSGAVGVEVRDLSHTYATPAGPLTVLDDVRFHVAPAEIVAVTGRSGAGKTTLLSLVGGLEVIQSGTITVGGTALAGLSGDRLAAYRRGTVGFVFQDYGLLPTLSALENVELALTFAGLRAAARRARARAMLDAVGVSARASHRPSALSGGESQRVAIARALANEPRLVLADEPTGNLDEAATDRVLRLLRSLPADHACTVVIVTHNATVAAAADRIVRLTAAHLEAVEPA